MPKVNPPNRPSMQAPQYPPPPEAYYPPKKRIRRTTKIALGVIGALLATFAIIVAIIFAAAGVPQTETLSQEDQQATSTANAANVAATNVALQNIGPQPTVTLPTDTSTSTPASQPTLTPIPSASELNQLLSSYGHVTNVSAPTLDATGAQGVAIDVQVDNPTQSRVKHLGFELAQFFFQRSDIGLINIAFHANGYTGPDDPIAGCGGLAPTGWTGMDENQLWNAMVGVFNANLSA